jgi:hypothetical protein
VLETSFSDPSSTTTTTTTEKEEEDGEPPQQLKVAILLEDPATGSLFAAAPYTAPATVEPTTDSSRFFALRVQDPSGKQKATLGVGFEERSEAFDFGVALQEAARALNWAGASPAPLPSSAAASLQVRQGGNKGGEGAGEEQEKRDLSLKEGETITVNLAGTRFGRRAGRSGSQGERKEGEGGGGGLASFSLPPPPPPSAREVRAQKRLSAQQLGFDDGQFGEFA